MNVTENREISDRTYAPYFRFSDGTVALLSADFDLASAEVSKSCLTFIAPEGAEVILGRHVGRKSIDADGARSGYVAIGSPVYDVRGGQVIVQDHALPKWIGDTVRSAIEESSNVYSSELGKRKIPDVFVFWTQSHRPESQYHGDTLPGSITLEFSGMAWKVPQESAREQIVGLVAHEMFHVWNSDAESGGAGDLLAKEGGAEVARELVEVRVIPGHESVLSAVSKAMNRCLYDLDARRALQVQLQAAPGDLPYSCGMSFVLAAASAGRQSMSMDDAFFSAWRSALGGTRRGGYDWEALLAGNSRPSVTGYLRNAIAEPGAFEGNVRKVLLKAGYEMAGEAELTMEERLMAAKRMMREIMASDCHGSVSFYTKYPSGFLVGPLPNPSLCASLVSNEFVVRIENELPWDRPISLSARVASACARRGYVSVTLKGERRAREIACTNSVRALPMPVDLRARNRAGQASLTPVVPMEHLYY